MHYLLDLVIMKSIINYFVIMLTLILFVLALFTKGLTHDILLEAAVFLVSAKIILATFRTEKLSADIKKHLDEIDSKLDRLTDKKQE